jgi:uracil-DNA glycosylase family 4
MPTKKELLQCKVDCTLCEGCQSPFMPPSGNVNAPLLFVGEGPGSDEDMAGIQFVGRAGQLLREALNKFGITDFAMDNVCACRPPDNRTPTRKEIDCCMPRLMNNIILMPNLRLVVPLGNIALQALTGQKSIMKLSGKLMPYSEGIQILPITHPSYYLRNQNEIKTFFDHIGRIPNALTGTLSMTSDLGNYIIIDDHLKWQELVEKIRYHKLFSYDVETNGLNPFVPDFKIKCIQFSTQPYEAYVLPIPHHLHDQVHIDLANLFMSKRIGKCGHNIKFDNLCLWTVYGWQVNSTVWDTSIVAHLLNENESHGLKDLAWRISKLGGYENKLSDRVDKVEGEELWIYGAIDVDLTERLRRIQVPEMAKDPDLDKLFHNLILPVNDVLTKMEKVGIRIDPVELDSCLERTDKYLNSLVKEIKGENAVQSFEEDTETEFNPNSHTQLREVLFKYEGLRPLKVTDKTKAPSTDRETLDTLAAESHLCNLLSEYSLYSAIKSKTLGELYNYKTVDNRIHTSFYLDSTATGRTSSRSPNMQNVPKGKKDVIQIRKVFIPDDDFLLVEADFNQHELRCIAEEAQDMVLLEALNGDVHRSTAAAVLGKKPEAVTKDERDKIGKVINFSLIYRVSAYGLSRGIGCEEDVAKQYIIRFFDRYSKTLEWMQKTEEFVRKNGYVKSRTGRYRRFPVWDELSPEAIRAAINMPIQCLVPTTKVLTKDLRWIPVGDIKVGERLIGIDEHGHRYWREAIVTGCERKRLPTYRVHLEDGTHIDATGEHPWLVYNGKRYRWRETKSLSKRSRLPKVFDVWETDKSNDAGYAAGIFDADGCLGLDHRQTECGYYMYAKFCQKEGIVQQEVERILKEKKFSMYKRTDLYRGYTWNTTTIKGGMAETMRFLGQIRPKRLLDKFLMNTDKCCRWQNAGRKYVQVSNIEFLGIREVIAIETSCHTFFAEGYPTHNSLAGDILLYALLGVDRFLTEQNLKSFLVSEIHDSLLLNVHKEEIEILPKIRTIMTTYFKKFIPFNSELKVDLKAGPNWHDLKEIV